MQSRISGANLALEESGKVRSEGCGASSSLEHKMPEDKLRSRRIETFQYLNNRIDTIARGQATLFAGCSRGNTLNFWGITKPENPICTARRCMIGIRSVATGQSSSIVTAEKSEATWGNRPMFGELSCGEVKPKSSAKPKIADALEGLTVTKVAMGIVFSVTLLRIAEDADENILDKLQ